MDKQALGAEIRRLREAQDINQRQLGELVGATQSTIADIESGRRGPSIPLLIKISRALGVTPNDILAAIATLEPAHA